MKATGILTALVLIASLAGCRVKESVVDENVDAFRVDTTKNVCGFLEKRKKYANMELESLTKIHTEKDTTKITTETEVGAVIGFVENGGTISISTDGNVVVTGVQSISGGVKRLQNEFKGLVNSDVKAMVAENETAKDEKVSAEYKEQNNGISVNEHWKTRKESATKHPVAKWWLSVLKRLGTLCCIAAMLWVLFLYLKRKF